MAAYHMIGYIHEAPDALQRTLESNEAALRKIGERARSGEIRRVIISGVGSSFTAAMIAAPVFTRFCPLPVHILPSTELPAYLPALVDRNTLLVAVSRSGERGWVVDSFREAINLGAIGAAITGRGDNLLAQNAPEVLLTGEGPEITFPKTKSVVTCAGLLARMALELSDRQQAGVSSALARLQAIPGEMRRVLEACEPQVQALVPKIVDFHWMLLGGTLGNYGVALEGALKLQEAGGLNVVGNETGNMLHGPWGTVGPGWLVALLVSAYDRVLCGKTLGLAGKTGAHRLAIVPPGLSMGSLAEEEITLPVEADTFLAGLVYLPVIQLLTYSLAVAHGLNPDAPANMQAIFEAMLPEGRQEPEMRIPPE